MATPAVATTATGTAGSGTSVTITKPASLAEGDLLVAVICSYRGLGGVTPNVASGWTDISGLGGDFPRARLQYKVATAGDAAATDFTFTTGSSVDSLRGILYRITGDFVATGPVTSVDSDGPVGSSTNPSFSISVTPLTASSLLIASFVASGSSAISAYTISGTNPTWTEQYETGSSGFVFANATATANSGAEITSFSLTNANNVSDNYAVLLAITEQQDAAGTLTHLAVSPTLYSPIGTADTHGTLTHLTVSPTLNSPSGSAANPKWSNTDKSSTISPTNLDKS